MRILILNHRDITNPRGGSAEVLIHEMAKRWVSRGHQVLWYCSRFESAPDEEQVDGVEIIRHGSSFFKDISAYLYYRKHLKGTIDIIIDATDILPFFAKLYNPRKTVLLTSEIVGQRASELYPFPVSLYWKVLEAISLFIYQNSPTFVLASSVKQEIVRRGSPAEYITVLPRGVSVPSSFKPLPREKEPTFIYLGKVNHQKGAGDALAAFATIRQTYPTARLWFAGAVEENYLQKLRGLVEQYKFGKDVSLFGFVSDMMKFELLSRSHILLLPSRFEAWGLTIPEAGIVGTPTIAYKTAGLSDLIDQGKTGVIVNPDPVQLANAAVQLLQNQEGYRIMQQNVRTLASKYNWDNTAQIALTILEQIHASQKTMPQQPIQQTAQVSQPPTQPPPKASPV